MKAIVKATGKVITGTLEWLMGQALIHEDSWTVTPGSIEFEYAGETDVWWDEQTTVTRKVDAVGRRERVFIDEDGNEVLESEIELVASEED